MQEIIMTGKTVDEAVEAACAALGLSRDGVSVEIVEMPQKKLFGSKPAKVKVTAAEDEFSVKSLLEDAGREAAQEKPQPSQPQPAAKPQAPAQPAPQPARRPEQQPRKPDRQPQEKQPPKQAPAPRQPEAEPPVEESPAEPIELDALPGAAKEALGYLQNIVSLMGAEKLTYAAAKTDRGIKFIVDGDDASLIIGRRGETMDALQYLCTLVCNRSDSDYSKVSLDVANYRSKREKTLVALAQREAAKVIKSRYSKTLEPMNPYERRIVHSAVQEIEGVKSESVGSEPNRRVVISLESGGKTRENNSRGRDGGSHGRGGRGRRNDRPDTRRDDARPKAERAAQPAPAEPAAPAPERRQEPELSGSLYGKIEL
ncbi:MAG: RNA-binding cell elongation regulator Jag/EloR [Oscillospiraceae bacterium]|nr:RNA-binding cell elongation regulator Jag/EloR [Oscillospiraceae bacterium]